VPFFIDIVARILYVVRLWMKSNGFWIKMNFIEMDPFLNEKCSVLFKKFVYESL
jgi:hypothetical protein